MKAMASGFNKLAMISVPVVIAIVLTLMLVLVGLWVGLNPVRESEAHLVPASVTVSSTMAGGRLIG